mgnify:CR=1 FL=1
MKTLFTSLPEHLLAPDFKDECQLILDGLNRFLGTTALDEDAFPNLASFMRHKELYCAYIEHAAEGGWNSASLNLFIEDRYYAAVAGFLMDGGRIADDHKIRGSQINKEQLLEDLIDGGFRGLYANMGLIHNQESVALTLDFSRKIFSMWNKQDLAHFVVSDLDDGASAKAVCIMNALGLKVCKFEFSASDLQALTSLDPRLFSMDSLVGTANVFDKVRQPSFTDDYSMLQTLNSICRSASMVDTKEAGLIGAIEVVAGLLPGLLEIPLFINVRDNIPAELIWHDVKGRSDLLCGFLFELNAKNYFSTLIALGVIREHEWFFGVEFPDQSLLEQQEKKLKVLWRAASPALRQQINAAATCVEDIAFVELYDAETKSSSRRNVMKMLMEGCAKQDKADLRKTEKYWPTIVPEHLWPVLLSDESSIRVSSSSALVSSFLIASLWAAESALTLNVGGIGLPFYPKHQQMSAIFRTLKLPMCEETEFRRRTLGYLHQHGSLTDEVMSLLGWGGDVLATLGFDAPGEIQAAMLRNDLGL